MPRCYFGPHGPFLLRRRHLDHHSASNKCPRLLGEIHAQRRAIEALPIKLAHQERVALPGRKSSSTFSYSSNKNNAMIQNGMASSKNEPFNQSISRRGNFVGSRHVFTVVQRCRSLLLSGTVLGSVLSPSKQWVAFVRNIATIVQS
jgi:hypothetical protein